MISHMKRMKRSFNYSCYFGRKEVNYIYLSSWVGIIFRSETTQ